jgi:glutamine amidotransferase-like uncharacterized protein
MTIAREAIQPLADGLINYEQYLAHLQRLSASPRVRIERVGASTEGRGLYTIVIAAEGALSNLDYHRTTAFRLQQPLVRHTTINEWTQAPRPAQPADLRFPTMVVGHTFGHEAAHLEALLRLADHLAWSDDPAVQAILAKQLVVIYPLANPDGREKAIEFWKTNPYGEDSHAAGDHYGFYVNRDLLHMTSPEGKGFMAAFGKWRPIMVYDAHEDVFFIGVQSPAICWAPAYGNAFGKDLPENMQSVVQKLSEGVIATWEAQGYEYLKADMFAYPMINQPKDQPHWFSQGTAITVVSGHGVPAIITESARTPGAQEWEGRLQQKFTAGMSLLGSMAAIADETVRQIYANAEAAVASGLHDAYIVPKASNNPAAIAQLIDILLKQDVLVYAADDDYVVPLAQPESYIARDIFESKLVGTPPALGLSFQRLSRLPAAAQLAALKRPLTPVLEAPAPRLHLTGSIGDTVNLAIANTPDGIRLLNRLWRLRLPVSWLVKPLEADGQTLPAGTFLIEQLPYSALRTLANGLNVRVSALPAGTTLEAAPLTKPALAVYLGQGVDRPDSVPKAEMWWAMERLEFDFVPLYGRQVRPAALEPIDVLLVPDGDPNDIVAGWQPASRRNASKSWDPPGEPNGIGQEGLAAIRGFVQAGGGYVGIGSGGGLLATADFAGLIDLSILHSSLGSGRVILRLDAPGSPVAYGFDGYTDESGARQAGKFYAFYYTESLASKVGGPIFTAGKSVTPVAYYHRLDNDPTTHYVLYPERFDESQKGVAIATARFGEGNVTVMGIRPGFRALWTNTLRLITNAIFQQVSSQPAKTITLS